MKNMNNTVLAIIAAIVILGGGAAALILSGDSDSNNNQTSTSESPDAMEKKEGEEAMEKHEGDKMEKDGDAMEKTEEGAMMKKSETYVTLADFESNKESFSDQKKVHFFHASWCPICKSIDEDITSDPSQIPSGTTFIKTDFDSSTALRQKYGVTTQYTFVQIDNDGNEVAQWSATSLDRAIAGIN